MLQIASAAAGIRTEVCIALVATDLFFKHCVRETNNLPVTFLFIVLFV